MQLDRCRVELSAAIRDQPFRVSRQPRLRRALCEAIYCGHRRVVVIRGETGLNQPEQRARLERTGAARFVEIRRVRKVRTGSSTLDNKALDDLGRISSFVSSSQYAGQAIVLLGFADSSGSPQVNDELSKNRANVVADEFRARGIKVAEVVGLGSERPVASNATAEGRDKNRRVEVWLRR